MNSVLTLEINVNFIKDSWLPLSYALRIDSRYESSAFTSFGIAWRNFKSIWPRYFSALRINLTTWFTCFSILKQVQTCMVNSRNFLEMTKVSLYKVCENRYFPVVKICFHPSCFFSKNGSFRNYKWNKQ